VKGSALVARRQMSPNVEPRPEDKSVSLIVLHYTGMATGQAAIDWLCNPDSKVSCHYLVDEDGTIVQMVDEALRAWHAGVSKWQGAVDINSISIGIEIQNQGHAAGCPAFPAVQMQSVARLTRDIMERYGLGPQNVVAHSDVAPGRKIDPGEAFDWDMLATEGIGLVASADADAKIAMHDVQVLLQKLGYGVETTGVDDAQTRIVLSAFQLRFRRAKVTGEADGETKAILKRLCAILPA
jgi:N-acetylmuramoyl-L-alanine amidase